MNAKEVEKIARERALDVLTSYWAYEMAQVEITRLQVEQRRLTVDLQDPALAEMLAQAAALRKEADTIHQQSFEQETRWEAQRIATGGRPSQEETFELDRQAAELRMQSNELVTQYHQQIETLQRSISTIEQDLHSLAKIPLPGPLPALLVEAIKKARPI